MKILDPNSVVRETEFANAEQAQGTLQRVFNIPSKFIKGTRLTQEGRQYWHTYFIIYADFKISTV